MGDLERNIYIFEEERRVLRNNRITILSGEIDPCLGHEFIEDIYLMSLFSTESINIIISSNGGDVESGMACIRAIRSAQKSGITVSGEVHGHAMSMAFLILQCCDYRKMGDLCILMAHGITSFSRGDIKNHESEGKLLRFWNRKFAEIISSRCIDKYSDIEYWNPIMADSTPQYYTSEESREMGLIDEVASFRI